MFYLKLESYLSTLHDTLTRGVDASKVKTLKRELYCSTYQRY